MAENKHVLAGLLHLRGSFWQESYDERAVLMAPPHMSMVGKTMTEMLPELQGRFPYTEHAQRLAEMLLDLIPGQDPRLSTKMQVLPLSLVYSGSDYVNQQHVQRRLWCHLSYPYWPDAGSVIPELGDEELETLGVLLTLAGGVLVPCDGSLKDMREHYDMPGFRPEEYEPDVHAFAQARALAGVPKEYDDWGRRRRHGYNPPKIKSLCLLTFSKQREQRALSRQTAGIVPVQRPNLAVSDVIGLTTGMMRELGSCKDGFVCYSYRSVSGYIDRLWDILGLIEFQNGRGSYRVSEHYLTFMRDFLRNPELNLRKWRHLNEEFCGWLVSEMKSYPVRLLKRHLREDQTGQQRGKQSAKALLTDWQRAHPLGSKSGYDVPDLPAGWVWPTPPHLLKRKKKKQARSRGRKKTRSPKRKEVQLAPDVHTDDHHDAVHVSGTA